MSKKIAVNEQCIGCGLCLSSSFLEEDSDGNAKAVGMGILTLEQEQEAKELMKNCPGNAIILEDFAQKNKNDLIQLLDNKPSEFQLEVPPKETFSFDAKSVVIALPLDTGNEYQYEYSSYKKALEAGKEVIRKNMFSNRVGIVQDIIGDYLTRNFHGYIEYKEVESNFYYAANLQAQKILNEMIGELSGSMPDTAIPDRLKEISTRPHEDKNGFGLGALSGGLMNVAGDIVGELSGKSYSLDSYADDLDYESMETYTTGAFGKQKTVEKYCYTGVRKAYEDIAGDIRSALSWGFDDNVIKPSYDSVEYITGQYEKKLKEELKEKAEQLKKLL
jgi:ferredoxin